MTEAALDAWAATHEATATISEVVDDDLGRVRYMVNALGSLNCA